jgi:hypothetical protein
MGDRLSGLEDKVDVLENQMNIFKNKVQCNIKTSGTPLKDRTYKT